MHSQECIVEVLPRYQQIIERGRRYVMFSKLCLFVLIFEFNYIKRKHLVVSKRKK